MMKSDGSKAIGWYSDNGNWHYLNEAGAMASNTTIDEYKLGADRAWFK